MINEIIKRETEEQRRKVDELLESSSTSEDRQAEANKTQIAKLLQLTDELITELKREKNDG